ncbi:MAG: ABC transporter substrate-binding protein [Deltaproteobacteria bacterium]|nr:ABC transporter substrate-binding protein [Deltaproteobacteria bacterium]
MSSLGAVFILALMILFVLPAEAREISKSKDVWTWARKNLDTGWMEWGRKYWPTKPVRGGYFRRAATRYVGLMNPNHWPVHDWDVIKLFYEGYTAYDGRYSQRVTWLMDSWEFINPTTLIMKLKPGVKFHDGTDFNAASFKYQFEWVKDKRNRCWTRGQMKRFKSLEVLDEYTLRWRTRDPWASFPTGFMGYMISSRALKGDILLMQAKSLTHKLKRAKNKAAEAEKKAKEAAARGEAAARKAAAEAEKARQTLARLEEQAAQARARAKGLKNTDQYPVGTGAFMFEDASPGNFLKVKRNPNWWFGPSVGHADMPYFDGIKIIIIPDSSIKLANLRAGKIDTMNLSKSQYLMLKDDPNLRVHVYPLNSMVGLSFNQAKGPCQDIRVRRAVSHAIDRKALIYGTQFGLARMASCMYPKDHWAHNPDLKPVRYDPELSKKLLAEAGYEKGLTIKGSMANDPASQTVAVALKSMLAKVGIDWKAVSLDPVAVVDQMEKLEFDLGGLYYPFIQDPDSPATALYHPEGGFNFGRNRNEKVIALIEAGRREVDDKKRQKVYYQLEKVLYHDYTDVWLWGEMAVIAFRKKVHGWNNDMYIKYRTQYWHSHPMWFEDGKP